MAQSEREAIEPRRVLPMSALRSSASAYGLRRVDSLLARWTNEE